VLTFVNKLRVLINLLLIISELILEVCIRKDLLLLLVLILAKLEFLDNPSTSVQVLLARLKLSSTLQASPILLVRVQQYFRVLPILVRKLRFQVSLI
jgi:hypothetical protein